MDVVVVTPLKRQGLVKVIAGIVQRDIKLKEQEERPQVRMKLTRSGKGVIIIVPDPNTKVAYSYITSVRYLRMLLDNELKFNLLGCKSLPGELPIEQFLTKDEKEVLGNDVTLIGVDGNAMGAKAQRERKNQEISIRDEW